MEQPKDIHEALEMVIASEPENNPNYDAVERAWEEGRKPTREEVYAWLDQFSYAQKLMLLEFLRALYAEREDAKEKAS